MSKGYQQLDPLELAPILRRPNDFLLAVALLSWIVSKINDRFPELLDGIELSVIKITEFGSYPSIGAHYTFANDDREEELLKAMSSVINSCSLLDFVVFYVNSREPWSVTTNRIMNSQLDDGEAPR